MLHFGRVNWGGFLVAGAPFFRCDIPGGPGSATLLLYHSTTLPLQPCAGFLLFLLLLLPYQTQSTIFKISRPTDHTPLTNPNLNCPYPPDNHHRFSKSKHCKSDNSTERDDGKSDVSLHIRMGPRRAGSNPRVPEWRNSLGSCSNSWIYAPPTIKETGWWVGISCASSLPHHPRRPSPRSLP